MMLNSFFRPHRSRWLTDGMRELSSDYGYYYPYRRRYRPFDPVATDILALEPDYPYYDDYRYPYPTEMYSHRRRNIHVPVGDSNNFFIDTAFINVEDPVYNRMDRMYRSYVRGLWKDEIEPNGLVFKRYRSQNNFL